VFKVVEPQAQAARYKDIVAGVYKSLAGEKGKICGFTFSTENNLAKPDFLEAIGVKTLIKFFNSINGAFAEYSLDIENIVIKGEKVMVKYNVSGIQTGKLMGKAASGGLLKVIGLDVFRLDQGKVVEYWNASHQIGPAL
jgi:predicted SnoaL-like aldol condensation-catalyzing enzyme